MFKLPKQPLAKKNNIENYGEKLPSKVEYGFAPMQSLRDHSLSERISVTESSTTEESIEKSEIRTVKERKTKYIDNIDEQEAVYSNYYYPSDYYEADVDLPSVFEDQYFYGYGIDESYVVEHEQQAQNQNDNNEDEKNPKVTSSILKLNPINEIHSWENWEAGKIN